MSKPPNLQESWAQKSSNAFMQEGGEIGAMMRAHDWQSTALGAPDAWPPGLRIAIGVILNSAQPMYIWWGPDLLCFYNDAFCRLTCPESEAAALGRPGQEVWGAKWDLIAPRIEHVRSGYGGTSRDASVPMTHNGRPEPTRWTYRYCAIFDPNVPSEVGGVLAVCSEDTELDPADRDQEGNVTGIFTQGTDVTSRAISDDALREREEQLRLAINAAEIGLWDVDTVTDTLYWPPRVKAMFGISAHVAVSMADYYNGLHPHDREHTVKSFEAALNPAKRALYDVEYRTVGKEDGVLRWVAAKGRAIFDGDRCVRVIGTAIDITNRKSAEEQLSQSELRRTFALEAGRLAAWEFEIASGKITWDARMHEFLGLPAGWPPAYSNGGQDMIIPEDRARVENEFNRAVTDGVAFTSQFRVRRPDGLQRWPHNRYAMQREWSIASRVSLTMSRTMSKIGKSLKPPINAKMNSWLCYRMNSGILSHLSGPPLTQ